MTIPIIEVASLILVAFFATWYAIWVEKRNKEIRMIVEKAKRTHRLCQRCPYKNSCYSLCKKYIIIYGKEEKKKQ